jgi:hypothetical protein
MIVAADDGRKERFRANFGRLVKAAIQSKLAPTLLKNVSLQSSVKLKAKT